MHDSRQRRGPGPALLLLIPAALLIAKGAKHRRAMWTHGGQGPAGYGFGHHHRFDRGDVDPRIGFRLPPKIEQALDAWHTAAHAPTATTEPGAAPGTATV